MASGMRTARWRLPVLSAALGGQYCLQYMSDIAKVGLSPATEQHKLDFVARVYYMRIMGTALCVLPIWSVLQERGAISLWLWMPILLNGLLWPHVAVALSRRAQDPAKQEFRNLTLDSFLGGIWIAVMAVGLVPAVVFMTILAMDKIAAGGWRLFARAQLALGAGFILAWYWLDFPFVPEVSPRTMLACAPLLFFYSIGLSYLMYRLGQRVVQQNRELKHLSLMDPGLGVPNRRFFEIGAEQVLERVRQGRQTASLLLADVDRFKEINDSHGHGIGDVVLKQLAAILRDEIRDTDLSARYGGDEFAVLLVGADFDRAMGIARRIRERVEEMTVEGVVDLICSVSVGVSQAKHTHESLQAWVADADSAMYRAKFGGRNRVIGN